ncbi:MAG: flagellar hook-length control protein FliK [Hydrogenophaga sp.]|uniref:flagellar hook-length control protein FliK n=1 Tax=Hydrogenophaga sp. TaxID=1904254 RepID=UPI003D11FBA7
MSAAHTVSRPAEPQRPAQPPHQGKAASDKPAEPDLFSSLLSLVSDTHLVPDMASPPSEPAASDALTQTTEDPNPLAALLAWAAPVGATGAPAASASTSPGAPGAVSTPDVLASPHAAAPALSAQGAVQAEGIDITGMTPVAHEPPPAAELPPQALPASAPARPAFATPAARPTFASRAEAAAPGGTPAMVWQRGAVSGTDALQQQYASQAWQHPHNPAANHVRSTVALDERFTTLLASAPREPGVELALPAGGGTRAASPDNLPGVNSLGSVDGNAAGDSTGGSAGDALPGDQPGQALDGTRAEPEAEGPTVSHWGTQHLRHASLRVGDTSADAIDIQLSMKGQEVQVAFQSDNAEARASLREGASEALAELLQRSGIHLGNVSVGAQGQQHGGAAPHTPTVSRGEMAGRAEAPGPQPAPPSPRTDGSRPLDLFV